MRNQKPPAGHSTRRPAQHEALRTPPRRAHQTVRPSEVRRVRRRVLISLYSLLAAECAAALFTSPWLDVKRIAIAGTSELPAYEANAVTGKVADMAHRNWLRAPSGSIEGSLRHLPWIANARVTREFPDGIHAEVQTREPLFIAEVGPIRYEMDAEDVPIRIARPQTDLAPLVVLPETTPVKCGEAIDDEAMRAATQIVESTRHDAVVRIAKIEVDPSHNICLNMQDGLPVRIGQPETLEDKIALLRRIYTRRPDIARSLTAIDVTCPFAPACTVREPSATQSGDAAPGPGRFE